MKMNYISRKQISEVDRMAIGEFGINIMQMMENAGRNLAEFVSKMKPKKVIVFFGGGNNGGGGLVAARHLAIREINVEIVGASLNNNENVQHQLKTLVKMGIKPKKDFKAKKNDIIIDALLGYNISGAPRDRFADLIKGINFMKENGLKVVSLDIPSGVHPDKGFVFETYVKADYVLTLALPKKGLKKLKNVYLSNIGIPKGVYKKMKIKYKNPFGDRDIVRVS